jgi:hypothetical protein
MAMTVGNCGNTKTTGLMVKRKIMKHYLPSPSDEQGQILDFVKEEKNIIVEAVAGSGKTTTSLLVAESISVVAQSLPKKKMLLITYNAELKKETRKKVKKYSIENLEVHSFHSLGLKYYRDECNNESHLADITRNNIPIRSEPDFDILVLDETQDMTKEYYKFVCRFIKDSRKENIQFIILGDSEQCIYDFPQKGADARFLTLADKLFSSSRKWERCTLSVSYRLTKAVEYFVNYGLSNGNERIKSAKEAGNPVLYIRGNAFTDVPQYLRSKVLELKSKYNYKWDDFFALVPSVKKGITEKGNQKPIGIFENLLKEVGIPILIPTSDEQELTEEETKGKFVFSTFHQSKGRERKVVIILDFSMTMYYYFRTLPTEVCPRVLKVACTRPMEHLILWGEDPKRNEPLPFINTKALENCPKYVEFVNVSQNDKRKKNSDTKNPGSSLHKVFNKDVTELIRFVPERIIHQCLSLLDEKIIHKSSSVVELEKRIVTNLGLTEGISDLTGIAISICFEFTYKGKSKLFDFCKEKLLSKAKNNEIKTDEERKWYEFISRTPRNISDYLKLANLYTYLTTEFKFRMIQIPEYDWLSDNEMKALVDNFAAVICQKMNNQEFEYPIEIPSYPFNKQNVHVMGRLDFIDDTDIIEGKCVDSLKAEHTIQLALYAAIWELCYKEKYGPRNFKLVNYRTQEVRQISNVKNVVKVLNLILENSFLTTQSITDEEFIEECISIRNGITSHREIGAKVQPMNECLIVDDD